MSDQRESMVRVARVELASQPWEGHILPMYYTRAGAEDGTRSRFATPQVTYFKTSLKSVTLP